MKEVGDQWRTPDLLFWGINALFGPLVLDLFADDDNAKCPAWYTAEDNALTQDWSERLAQNWVALAMATHRTAVRSTNEKQAITGMTHIMKYAATQREKGGRYVFLIKPRRVKRGGRKMPITLYSFAGALGLICLWFVPADENRSPPARFAGAIAVFDKSWRGERFSYINRTGTGGKRAGVYDFGAICCQQVSTCNCHTICS